MPEEGKQEAGEGQEAASQAAGTAPEKKDESAEGGKGSPQKKPSRSLQDEIVRQRAKKREANQRADEYKTAAEALQKRVEELERAVAERVVDREPESVPSADAIAAKVLAEIRKEQSVEKATQRMADAEQYIKGRSHCKEDPEFLASLRDRVVHECAADKTRDPLKAAKLAYVELCEEKGVAPDIGRQSTPERQSSGVRSSAAGSASSQRWTPEAIAEEVRKYRIAGDEAGLIRFVKQVEGNRA